MSPESLGPITPKQKRAKASQIMSVNLKFWHMVIGILSTVAASAWGVSSKFTGLELSRDQQNAQIQAFHTSPTTYDDKQDKHIDRVEDNLNKKVDDMGKDVKEIHDLFISSPSHQKR